MVLSTQLYRYFRLEFISFSFVKSQPDPTPQGQMGVDNRSLHTKLEQCTLLYGSKTVVNSEYSVNIIDPLYLQGMTINEK